MNRTTALLLALAALLAHALGIHDSIEGKVAPPWEVAHVSYRVGRNIAYEKDPNWDPGVVSHEAYPSFIWVAVAATAEQFYLPPTAFAQVLGLLSALATIVVLARFSPKRLAGIIAPILLVASGGMAAAALSGTEVSLFTLLFVVSFLCFEHRRRAAFAIALCLLILTRPEGLVIAAAFAVFEIARRFRRRPDADSEGDPSLLLGLLPPLIVWGCTLLLRHKLYGHAFSAPIASLADPVSAHWKLGAVFLLDWAVRSSIPLLLVFPAVHLVTGKLMGPARRALLLVLLWLLLVARSGGDGRPYWCAVVPALPLLALAVQNGMIHSMQWHKRFAEPATWAAFLLALIGSAFISKHAGDLGPIPTDKWVRRLLNPSEDVKQAWRRNYGRQGLHEEIATVERLRSIGVFLRDRIPTEASILTPWPGTLGYLSRKHVIDLLGRASPVAGVEGPQPFSGVPRGDVVAALEQEPDYVVGSLSSARRPPTYRDLASEWLVRYDRAGFSEERLTEMVPPLRKYELVSVPVPISSDRPRDFTGRPVHILRRKGLALAPVIALELETGDRQRGDGVGGVGFHVDVRHKGHHQLVDLEVRLIDVKGNKYSMRPTGEFVNDARPHARTEILLYETGDRSVELVRGRLPEDIEIARLTAVLVNPGSQSEKFFSVVSNFSVRNFAAIKGGR